MKETIIDLGFQTILMPNSVGFAQMSPPTCMAERLWIEECFGVYLCGVTVGNRAVEGLEENPVSTLFYSMPVNDEAIEQMKKIIAAVDGAEPRYIEDLVGASRSDPTAVLGLPVQYPRCQLGNIIRFRFENRGVDPVRVTGVLRARAMVES